MSMYISVYKIYSLLWLFNILLREYIILYNLECMESCLKNMNLVILKTNSNINLIILKIKINNERVTSNNIKSRLKIINKA